MELLVTMGVLAALASLLIPVSTRVLNNARQAKCAGNLRGIGGLIGTWIADNDGRIPPASNSSNPWPFLLISQVLGEPIKPGGMRYDQFYCPTLSAAGHDGNSKPTSGYWTTYAANWQVMGTGSSYPIRRISEFSKLSRTGLLWDACPSVEGPPKRSVSGAAWYHIRAGDPNQTVGWVHGTRDPQLRRHGTANVLFLDGHVEGLPDPGDGNFLPIARQGTQLWE